LNINYFAKRSALSGALYIYTAKGLGATAGIVCGWSLTLAYLLVAAAVAAGFANYSSIVLQEFGLQVPSILLYALCIGIAWYYAYTDIQLSTILMLVLELLAVGAIAILAIFVIGKQGFVDTRQLTLEGVTPSGISLGMVLAILSYVGFESATTLGDEAKAPTRYIPLAIVWSTILTGLFFIFISYAEVLGFRNNEVPLNESVSVLRELSVLVKAEFIGTILDVGIAISFLSCSLASLNAGARIAFSLSRNSFYPSSLSGVHNQNQTPHIAVSLSALIVFLVSGSMSLFGLKDLDVYGYLGTISTYGFLCAYILVSIAAPFYLSRSKTLRSHHIVISASAVIFMLIPVVGSFYPVPAFPFNVFPYLFFLYLAVGGVLFLVLRNRSPKIIERMERDFTIATLTAIQNQANK
ncbi:MAG TPA: APC family permease, partial [Coleofasciculaceae cyanobacterium]